MKQIVINQLPIEIERKRIKNMYLRILPPEGRIHISAPLRISEEEIKRFILSKYDWILIQQEKLQQRHTHQPMDYVTGDEIFLWGLRYHLSVINKSGRSKVVLMNQDTILLYSKEDSTPEERKRVIDGWYKNELNNMIPSFIQKWEHIIGVNSSGFTIRDMKTRWGTCNIRTKKICLSLQLAKKPPRCLEYVVVHELVHLLESSHNHIFKGYLDQFLPEWREIKKELNGAVIS